MANAAELQARSRLAAAIEALETGQAEAALIAALAAVQRLASITADDSARSHAERARALYHVEGEVEIDQSPVVSASDEGAYVQAWVWVDKPDDAVENPAP